ncbi:hypothetical protein GCM10023350_35810 [Nocardioides endophyticus]|uniref:Bacterial Ig-like domain-containing protein n=1 Tax=Nocardioides endophyticus TaxID=1353775 RepID=A0ABP8Z6B4_9ACTN
MRARLARLAVLTATTSLVVAGAVGAVPSASADPAPSPNLVVNIVDTAGSATKGMVMLWSISDPEAGPIPLGEEDPDSGAPILASSYQALVPPGDYALFAITGWGGTICLGVSPCSISTISTGPLGGPGSMPNLTAGVTVPVSGAATVNLSSGLPALTGSGIVGQPLTVDFPAGFDDLQTLMNSYLGVYGAILGTTTAAPGVVWTRNGQAIPGATGTTYVPTAQDVGNQVVATTSYNLLLAALLGSMSQGTFQVPAPFTTTGITVKKVATAISLKVPAKIKFGKRPTARITAKTGTADLSGWTTLKISGTKGQQRVLVRKGFAQVKLPKLKPGKHKVTATFIATNVYVASQTTEKIVVQKKKKHKK